MREPGRTQPSGIARSTRKALSLTSPQSALNDDVPQVLEHSMGRLADIKQRADIFSPYGAFVLSCRARREVGDLCMPQLQTARLTAYVEAWDWPKHDEFSFSCRAPLTAAQAHGL
jgi:hypothetical protein